MLLYLEMFILALVRIAGFFFATPIYGSDSVIPQARIGLSVMITLIVMPQLSMENHHLIKDVFPFFVAIAREILIGFSIGYIVTLLFEVVQVAGTIYGNNMGFGMVNVFDPTTSENYSIVGYLWFILLLLIYFSLNGHLYLFKAIIRTFKLFPLTQISYTPDFFMEISKMFVEMFKIGVSIAIPMTAAVFIAQIVLGFLAKIAPKVQIFTLTYPLKIETGFLFLILLGPTVLRGFPRIIEHFHGMFLTLYKLLRVTG